MNTLAVLGVIAIAAGILPLLYLVLPYTGIATRGGRLWRRVGRALTSDGALTVVWLVLSVGCMAAIGILMTSHSR